MVFPFVEYFKELTRGKSKEEYNWEFIILYSARFELIKGCFVSCFKEVICIIQAS